MAGYTSLYPTQAVTAAALRARTPTAKGEELRLQEGEALREDQLTACKRDANQGNCADGNVSDFRNPLW